MRLFNRNKEGTKTPSTVKLDHIREMYVAAVQRNKRALVVQLNGSVTDSFLYEVRLAITNSNTDWDVTQLFIDGQGNLQINMKRKGEKRTTYSFNPANVNINYVPKDISPD